MSKENRYRNQNKQLTEYGVAKLRQRTVKQRVENLIAVARPDFREELRKEVERYMYY